VKKPVIIAHRGASHYHHENTLAAFEAAVEMGAAMVELDVRRTGDNILVAHHDAHIAGETISGISLEEAASLSAEAGYQLTLLEDIFKLLAGKCTVDVELKESGYEEQVVELALDYLAPDSLLFSSYDHEVIRRIKEVDPGLRTGLIIGSRPRHHLLAKLLPGRRARAVGADVIIISSKLLPFGFLKLNSGLGLPIWIYTVNDRQELWKLITDGRVDGIFTDRPDVGLFLRDLHAVSQNTEFRIQNSESG
jgi:glycerophosphoryl diester phosphodiesterase